MSYVFLHLFVLLLPSVPPPPLPCHSLLLSALPSPSHTLPLSFNVYHFPPSLFKYCQVGKQFDALLVDTKAPTPPVFDIFDQDKLDVSESHICLCGTLEMYKMRLECAVTSVNPAKHLTSYYC